MNERECRTRFVNFLVFFFKYFLQFQNESELHGRTIRVNIAKPMKFTESSMKAGRYNMVDELENFSSILPL